jgi:molybdopterin converting factor small subunit
LTLGFMAEVRFLGELRKAAGMATFGVDAGTVEELLEQLRGLMGPTLQEFLFEGEQLQQDVEVLVNGQNISFLDGLKTALAPFDQVTLFINGVRRFPGG